MPSFRRFKIVAALAALAALAPVPAAAAGQQLVDAARKEGKVVVYSVLSTKAAKPLCDDFEALYPGIDVDYDGDKGSTEMDARYRSETAAGKPTADVVWSSASDMQMKLVQDGYAATYRSPEAGKLPRWAVHRNQAYGTTLEPVVFAYNTRLLTGADIPQDHAAFTRLLETQSERLRGKVTGFDIVKSGVGYMFLAQDRIANPQLDRLLRAMGSVGFNPSGGTGEMLTAISKGDILLGYNMMGAYALSRGKRDLPNLGVVFPKDYTLVLSRVAFVGKRAAHPNAARLWLDYLLSKRGQTILGNALELYPIRTDVEADYTAAKLRATLGNSLRPIPLDMSLARQLAPTERDRILAQWAAALAPAQ